MTDNKKEIFIELNEGKEEDFDKGDNEDDKQNVEVEPEETTKVAQIKEEDDLDNNKKKEYLDDLTSDPDAPALNTTPADPAGNAGR